MELSVGLPLFFILPLCFDLANFSARKGLVKVQLDAVPVEAKAEARVPAEVEAGVSLGSSF